MNVCGHCKEKAEWRYKDGWASWPVLNGLLESVKGLILHRRRWAICAQWDMVSMKMNATTSG